MDISESCLSHFNLVFISNNLESISQNSQAELSKSKTDY